MAVTSIDGNVASRFSLWGLLALGVGVLAAGVFYWEGIVTLTEAWQLPEYSHGPLIPLLSGLLFLRQLKTVPVNLGPVRDRWVGVGVLLISMALAMVGKLAHIGDVVAYALILWVGALLLISFGWKQGREFWPPVLHLVYMLPLPGLFYYKVSTELQFVSSELGVTFLRMLNVPVFLDGNIIDLGVYQLHVAEACSGLRYLFPILSFSYIFAVLYRGPMWHKAVLLLSAAPITVLMNSVRIAVAGVIVNNFGIDHVEGLSHFFEGWVVFVVCVLFLFGLARLMLFLHPEKMSLVDALDLETEGLFQQFLRLRFVQPSAAMITATVLMVAAAGAWTARPAEQVIDVPREPFALFPKRLDDWEAGIPQKLPLAVERNLGADDYHSVYFFNPEVPSGVEFFAAYYLDQTKGGIHSPEVCLPGGGWEFAELDRRDVAPELGLDAPFRVNRAVIQKGQSLMLVYYYFQQQDKAIAWDYAAKAQLLVNGVTTGRTDGALVRFTTPINDNETVAQAEERLQTLMVKALSPLERFIPR